MSSEQLVQQQASDEIMGLRKTGAAYVSLLFSLFGLQEIPLNYLLIAATELHSVIRRNCEDYDDAYL